MDGDSSIDGHGEDGASEDEEDIEVHGDKGDIEQEDRKSTRLNSSHVD